MSKCPILKNCDQCHKEFVVFKGPLQHKKFCSRNCYNEQIKSTKTNCLVCGIQIPSKNKYCSHSCAAGHTNKQRGTRSQETKDKIRQKLSGRQYPERRRILRPGTCIICNVPTIDVGRQTCSKTCKNRLHQLQSMLQDNAQLKDLLTSAIQQQLNSQLSSIECFVPFSGDNPTCTGL